MPTRRTPIQFATLVSLILLLFGGSGFPGDDPCARLPIAKANELLALPAADTVAEWIPPGVACTWEGTEYKPRACTAETKITQDRMTDDVRLIVVNTSGQGPLTVDYAFKFACVGGRITDLTHAGFNPAQKEDYAPYAAPPGVSGMPTEFRPRYRCPPVEITRPYGAVGGYTPSQCEHSTTAIACSELSASSADQLLTIPMDGWRGAGCYAKSRPDRCDWQVALRDDRMISDARRLVDVSAVYKGIAQIPWCSDQVYVFGCVDGEARTVFEYRFSGLKKIEWDGEWLIVRLWSRDLSDVTSRNPSIDWETRMTYGWSTDLQNYVLREVHYGPPPKGDPLPKTPPTCVFPSSAGSETPR